MRRTAMPLVLLAALAVAHPADADAAKRAKKAKAPVVTKVSPLQAVVGQTLTLRGRNFRPGKGKNGVGFKASGRPIVFVRSGLSTRRLLKVTLPPRLESVLGGRPKRLRIRVLTSRFGKAYTTTKRSPMVAPRPAAAPVAPIATSPTLPATATGTGVPVAACNAKSTSETADQDADRLPDALEGRIGTDPCNADTDGDSVEDGYEYRSAIDLNDDEYQQPNAALPYPGKRPYPNPLDGGDREKDFDGDGLSLAREYSFWLAATPAASRSFADAAPRATPLAYSDGMQYSVSEYCPAAGSAFCGAGDDGRRVPVLQRDDPGDSFQTFWSALRPDYRTVRLSDGGVFFDHTTRSFYDLRDTNLNGAVSATEQYPDDRDGDGLLADDERDVDHDGLTNYDETVGRGTPQYWTACYAQEPPFPIQYAATDPVDADSDGDGVPDAADDQDHDDVPNAMELSRRRASGLDDREPARPVTCQPYQGIPTEHHPTAYGFVNPFNPCLPYRDSRTCPRVIDLSTAYAPFTGSVWWSLQ